MLSLRDRNPKPYVGSARTKPLEMQANCYILIFQQIGTQNMSLIVIAALLSGVAAVPSILATALPNRCFGHLRQKVMLPQDYHRQKVFLGDWD